MCLEVRGRVFLTHTAFAELNRTRRDQASLKNSPTRAMPPPVRYVNSTPPSPLNVICIITSMAGAKLAVKSLAATHAAIIVMALALPSVSDSRHLPNFISKGQIGLKKPSAVKNVYMWKLSLEEMME